MLTPEEENQELKKIAQDLTAQLFDMDQENQKLKEIAKQALPYLDRIGGAIHLSAQFRQIIHETPIDAALQAKLDAKKKFHEDKS